MVHFQIQVQTSAPYHYSSKSSPGQLFSLSITSPTYILFLYIYILLFFVDNSFCLLDSAKNICFYFHHLALSNFSLLEK